MKVIKRIAQMSSYSRRQRALGKRIGFIPTMGALHNGHLSLIRASKKECDVTVVSIFVNPTQFGPMEDFKKYPRDIERDKFLCNQAGVDALFIPSAGAMYPAGYCSYVEPEGLKDLLCGKARPGHFRGVATVVNKLFNIVRPDIAYFGQKDAQQAIIIKRMVEDLNMNLKVRVCPIVREPDGLAMSSRNAYLSPKERKDAVLLFRALSEARSAIEKGKQNAEAIRAKMRQIISTVKSARIDYISITDAEDLTPLDLIKDRALIALAVWIGKTRLIDNIVVRA